MSRVCLRRFGGSRPRGAIFCGTIDAIELENLSSRFCFALKRPISPRKDELITVAALACRLTSARRIASRRPNRPRHCACSLVAARPSTRCLSSHLSRWLRYRRWISAAARLRSSRPSATFRFLMWKACRATLPRCRDWMTVAFACRFFLYFLYFH